MIMKRNARTPFYELMCRVEEDCPLAIFLNKVISKLDTVKILFAPRTFKDANDTNKENGKSDADRFYQSCLWELWFHNVISRFHEWDDMLNEYFSEYEGKWKFYACSKRLESIKEYGGDENDYNEDGSIRTLNLTEDDLKFYTVLGKMVQDDCRDIVQETTYYDLQYMVSCLKAQASFSISDAFKECFGKEITTYKQDEDGNMVPINFADKALNKAEKQDEADIMDSYIYLICTFIEKTIEKIKSMNMFCDNTEELSQIHKDVKNMIDFNFLEVSIFKIPF